jgi:type IV pilus assembly protein PilF
MRRTRKIAAGLMFATAVALLAACTSTGNNGRQVDTREAAKANVQLGIAYMQQGNMQLAKDKLTRAEKQDPKSHEVQWALASLYERIGERADAERHYQTAMRLAPGNPEITNTYAVFLCKTGQTDKAIPLYDAVMRDRLYATPWAAATNAGVCLRADKRPAEALPYFERALSQRPDYVTAVVELGDTQIAIGKPDQARATVDRFVGIGRKSADVLLVGVRAALAEGNRAAADIYARLLRRDFPNTPQAQSLQQLLGDNRARP